MRKLPLVAACFCAFELGAAPKPNLDEALRKLPPSVALLTHPMLLKPGFHAQDGRGSCQVLPPEQETDPVTYRVSVTAPTEEVYHTGLGWTCPDGPDKDDVLVVSFEARSLTPGQRGDVRAVFRRSVRPYNHALRETCRFRGNWTRFTFPVSPTADMRRDGILLTLNMGAQAQEIELRDVRLLHYGKKVALARLAQTLGVKPAKGNRRAVGQPVDVDALWNMAAFSTIAPTDENFNSHGPWTATYAIWTCHGYVLTGNHNQGILKLGRTLKPNREFVALDVEQTVMLDQGIAHITNAHIVCQTDTIATPVSWSLQSRWIDPDGNPIERLDADEDGTVETDGILLRVKGEGSRKLALSGPVAAEWCFFDAVQRLPRNADARAAFDFLEGLSLLKNDHRLIYRGSNLHHFGDRTERLFHYVQTGRGTLPWNYWVNTSGRLLVAVTHSRAYLLDPEAETKYAAYRKGQIGRYRRSRNRVRKGEGAPP